jgi:hypothetical protein
LWHFKFRARWPCSSSSSSSSPWNDNHHGSDQEHNNNDSNSWYISYQRAYRHPHDLWITHWNCVYPNDALSPGQCCVSPPSAHCNTTTNGRRRSRNGKDDDDDHSNLCPTCRYDDLSTNIFQRAWQREVLYQRHGKLQTEDPVTRAQRNLQEQEDHTTTLAKRMAWTTQYFLAKACRRLYQEFCQNIDHDDHIDGMAASLFPTEQHDPDDRHDGGTCDDDEESVSPSCHYYHTARRAFQKAATFHRHISPEQYRTDRLCFLQDLLFFNVTTTTSSDAWTRQGHEESLHLQRDVYGSDEVVHDTTTTTTTTTASIQQHHHHHPPTSSVVTHYGEYETAHHSWHVAHFTNPDACRPITFRIFVQRPDCFSVYPSDGYLLPGASCALVFSVRPMGSLLSEAFDALNVHREGVDPFLGHVYTEEAHLPYAPYCVRYMYAPMTPCIPPNYHPSQQQQQHQVDASVIMSSSAAAAPAAAPAGPPWVPPHHHLHPPTSLPHTLLSSISKDKHMIDHLWDSVATEADIRTIYLSAHVVSHHYPFLDFQQATLRPFSIRRGPERDETEGGGNDDGVARHTGSNNNNNMVLEGEPLVVVAPELQAKDPRTFQVVHNMRLEVEMSPAGEAYRTEPPCEQCGQRWGLRLEELGHAYVVGRMECLAHGARRNATIRNITLCVQQVQEMMIGNDVPTTDETMKRIVQLLYVIHAVLQQFKNYPLITFQQLNFLLRLECTVDELCVRINTEFRHNQEASIGTRGEGWIPWRHSGVYPYLTCTDSIFHPSRSLPTLSGWKEEPNYLDAFRHLAHSPGRYCLGPREDPNHLGETLISEKSRFYRKQSGCVTDLFMDDPVCAMECAVCMLHDPRSLLVHGIYDRIFVGNVARRPKLPLDVLSFLDYVDCHATSKEDWNLTSKAVGGCDQMWSQVVAHRTAYYQLQDALDLHSLGIWGETTLYNSASVRRYIRNIPAPGRGRFGLSKEGNHALFGSDRAIMIVPWDPQDSLGGELLPSVVNATAQDGLQPQQPDNGHGGQVQQVPFVNPEGARIHNLLGVLSAHFGWRVDESQGVGLVFVDRRIMIATQMVSISLMIGPMLGSLLARSTRWIPTQPITYHLEDMPFALKNEMR